ncbi:flagellar assembly protein A [Janthinobacterium fluminis]|uniref:FapA family protein n=1 Tax=Janthinobacterium fluminis TaxID=2987524 RepID=A0ABT5JTV9_9BURK|nr:flagellar assembly protein A [Janthinobacterium fluminis]MDC8756138.1 FapA family protein [Janthinobacterium fluminis]
MSDDLPVADCPLAPPGGDAALPAGMVRRGDGIFFDAAQPAPVLLAAVGQVFQSNAYFAGLDYAVFTRALYNCGAPLPAASRGAPLIRFAAAIVPFDPLRRALYKLVKIQRGVAEYYFEAQFFEALELPDGSKVAPRPTKLDFDEFVADMWAKGVRFGIDAAAVQAIIDSGKVERIVVARRLEAAPGRDATVVEVSPDMHRDDAPREMADGRLDLLTFKNRFPQVKKHARLLKKLPSAPGLPGYELSGQSVQPPAPREVELAPLAGEGTLVERVRGDEYLVAVHDGFVNVDAASGAISIGAKIVSRDGVSSRTTGNLKLRAEYEEFGEVQEQRTVDGSDITVHGDVFGHLHSHGGTITLLKNLIGGTALNAHGDIVVKGVASGSVLQTSDGGMRVERAENCIISGTRIVVGHASNCEIIGDEVVVGVAEGCAIAGRSVQIDSAGPRKQTEMLVYALVPDMARMTRKMAELGVRAQGYARAVAKLQQEIDQVSEQLDVRNYLLLANKVRKQELVLLPEQVPLFHKMALTVAPALKTISKLSMEMKFMETQQAQMLEQAAEVERQKQATAAESRCAVRALSGDIVVRTSVFNPESGRVYDKPPRDIKARLRGGASGADIIFAGHSGSLDWTYRLVPA